MSNKFGALTFDYALLVLLAFLWGSSFTLIKIALESYPPMTMVTARMLIAGFILLAITIMRRGSFPNTPRRWLELIVQGVVQTAFPFTLISWGEQYIDSGLAGLINSTPPMFVFLLTLQLHK